MFGASLWVIMTLLLMIVMVVTALKPTLTTIADLWGQIEQRRDTIKKLDLKITDMQTVSGILSKQQGNFELLNEALPGGPEWETLAGYLEDSASNSGAKIISMSWGVIPVSGNIPVKTDEPVKNNATSIPEGTKAITFKIVCGGEYPQIREMARRIENLRRLSIITGFSIGRNQEGLLTTTIDGVAVYSGEVAP